MIKHVGKHNNRKIVLLWRKVPNENHMGLVAYSDTLPRLIHDEVMKALESPIGQNATDFSDVLFRTVMADGRNALEVMHKEGFIKKVPTSQILITPTAKSSVRLDELNDILDEMSKGEEAIKKLADIDKNAGMQTKKPRQGREVGMPPNNSSVSRTNVDVDSTDSAAAYLKGVLSDNDLAEQRLSQAEQMKTQAAQLIAEAKRLEEEAKQLTPAKNGTTKSKKTTTAKKQAA
jgi:Ni,Fe-hydrogenase I large subunit